MPRRSLNAAAARQGPQNRRSWSRASKLVLWLALAAPIGLLAAVALWARVPADPERITARAEALARAGDNSAAQAAWQEALTAWQAVNRTDRATAQSWLSEARVCLALGRAAQAERALVRAARANPSDPAPWLLRLSLLHVEDRMLEAKDTGWAAFEAVSAPARRDVLRALTLALLTDTPDDPAREQLQHWVAADPDDVDARVALLRRMTALPRAGDPDRSARITSLTELVARQPRHAGAREALVNALADAGDFDTGRTVLEAWPADQRDARFYRLLGRWDLEYDHKPAEAAQALRQSLAQLPHDWKAHFRLSRALSRLEKTREARAEAQTVARLREVLDPEPLGRRLAADFAHLDDPAARQDVANLCDTVGLHRLASAWRSELSPG